MSEELKRRIKMLKNPLTNEQMKKLVGRYLTKDYGDFKYLVTGYCEDMNGIVSILIADKRGETRYSASDLVNSNFRIDSPDGKGLWNDSTEDVLRIVDNLIVDIFREVLVYAKGISPEAPLDLHIEHMREEAESKLKSILSEESDTHLHLQAEVERLKNALQKIVDLRMLNPNLKESVYPSSCSEDMFVNFYCKMGDIAIKALTNNTNSHSKNERN